MERVTFLVERTGERIPCLLNPEGLEVRRTAGLARRRSAGGAVLGNPRTDDPVVATGGGITEYELKLLFDVDLVANSATPSLLPATPPAAAPAEAAAGLAAALDEAEIEPASDPAIPDSGDEPEPPGEIEIVSASEPTVEVETPAPTAPDPSPPPTVDVRSLTQPLWALAENGEAVGGRIAPQAVRFIWGRSWNVPCVILAVAERLERFDAQGVPQRSWLSLLLRRVEEQLENGDAPAPPTSPQFEVNPTAPTSDAAGDESVTPAVDEEGYLVTNLYLIAEQHCGDPRCARLIAEHNGLDDMFRIPEGQPLRLPPCRPISEQA